MTDKVSIAEAAISNTTKLPGQSFQEHAKPTRLSLVFLDEAEPRWSDRYVHTRKTRNVAVVMQVAEAWTR